jgi:hypothetical protein
MRINYWNLSQKEIDILVQLLLENQKLKKEKRNMKKEVLLQQ